MVEETEKQKGKLMKPEACSLRSIHLYMSYKSDQEKRGDTNYQYGEQEK